MALARFFYHTILGIAVAKLLSAEGANVIVTGCNPASLAAARQEPPGITVLSSGSGFIIGEDLLIGGGALTWP